MKKCYFVAAPLLAVMAQAHVGSPDVFVEGKAGPYQMFVTVRPPGTIPGVAELEVRSESAGVREVRAVPLRITGPGAKFAPVPDILKVSQQDRQFFTGALWLMTSGSWQVRLTVDGDRGQGVMSIPVPSVARVTKSMDWKTGTVLGIFGVFLVGGLAAVFGAAREALLVPGAEPDAQDRRSGRITTAISLLVLLGVVWGGKAWWDAEAKDYATRIYKPLQLSASVDGDAMTLKMTEPGWMQNINGAAVMRIFTRKLDDLVPDHGHLMHLYAIRQPGMDRVYHLHPTSIEPGVFRETLPSTESGHYKLYADIVHANGFAETMVSEVELPARSGKVLGEDEAAGAAEPWQNSSFNQRVFVLPDGYRMELVGPKDPFRANAPEAFQFRLTRADGSAPPDMALYMGMLGHAAFLKTDGSVFAHVHPNGSASMAAMMLADPKMNMPAMEGGMEMDPSMHMEHEAGQLPNTVGFPYGFPSPGRYRIFVQMKHGETVETGAFDVDVR